MPSTEQLPVFFICANGADGFVSRLGDCYDPQTGWQALIIKGGPGTGKSTMMKRVASQMAKAGQPVQLIACTGDPGSLDAVILPNQKTVLMDGTPPHPLEPKFPGVCEQIIDVGAAFDLEKLRQHRAEILACSRQNRALHAGAAKYIGAAGALLRELGQSVAPATDIGKATAFGVRIAKKYLPRQKGQGREQIRFLSGVTCKGHIFYDGTVGELCDKVIAVEDDYGPVAGAILAQVRRIALERGYDIITCPCPLFPDEKIDHVLIPALRLAFCTQNRYLQPKAARCIHARRFMQAGQLRKVKQRVAMARRTVKELFAAAVQRMAEAKAVHDRLEGFYIPAVDFAKVDAITNGVLASLDVGK